MTIKNQFDVHSDCGPNALNEGCPTVIRCALEMGVSAETPHPKKRRRSQPRLFSMPIDPKWRRFAADMIGIQSGRTHTFNIRWRRTLGDWATK